MQYHFKVHKEDKFYWAECLEISGCVTQADSLDDLKISMQQALNLYLEEPEGSKDLAPMPDLTIKKSKNIVEVRVDPQIAFAFLVRFHRLSSGMTQRQVAKQMGFDNIFSYQRLESPKSNPSLKTISKLVEVFPDFPIDQAVA